MLDARRKSAAVKGTCGKPALAASTEELRCFSLGVRVKTINRMAVSRFWNKIKAVTLWCSKFAGSPWFKIAAWITFVMTVTVKFSYDHWCWLSDGESGSTTVRNLGLMVAALIGLPIAIWRSLVAERQAETAQRRLLNERYQKSAEMLGSEVPSVRLGGIYDLTRLAREQPGDYLR